MGFDVEDVPQKLDIGEKARLLSGSDMWHTHAVERLNIPKICVRSLPQNPDILFECTEMLSFLMDLMACEERGSLME
jgi:hypothetical protein